MSSIICVLGNLGLVIGLYLLYQLILYLIFLTTFEREGGMTHPGRLDPPLTVAAGETVIAGEKSNQCMGPTTKHVLLDVTPVLQGRHVVR